MDGGKIYEERSPNSSRVKFLEHCFGGTLTTVNLSTSHLGAGSHRMSWTTERGQARKHPNSETSPARESAGSLRTPRNKSTVDTAAVFLEGNFTRPRRHRADFTNIELVGLLTILQNQTIFEIFIPSTSIRNLDPVLRHSISTPRHDKLAISTPIQTPCWAFSKYLCANSSVKKPSK